MKFNEKVVMITGGSSGIGKAAAKRFLEEGARIVIGGRRESALAETQKELDPGKTRVAVVQGDIAKPATSRQMVKTAVEKFGGVDILINNAGIFKPAPFLDHGEAELSSFIDIILKGSFYAAQAVVPEMKKRGGGAIVNTGSMWALQAVGLTPSTAYSAAKAGVHSLTKNLAIELAKDNIRVNAVAPGVVETPVFSTFLTPDQIKGLLPTLNAYHPLGRIGRPEDVASAILFFAGDDSKWITGAVLPVDGGVTAGRQ